MEYNKENMENSIPKLNLETVQENDQSTDQPNQTNTSKHEKRKSSVQYLESPIITHTSDAKNASQRSRKTSVISIEEGKLTRTRRASKVGDGLLLDVGDLSDNRRFGRRRSRVGDQFLIRDKLKGGRNRHQGTPENVQSDSTEGSGDVDTQKSNAIINDEIRALEIKPEDFEKLREPRPPAERKKTPVSQQVVVRKLKPASEWNKPKPQPVTVARPAPPEAPLKDIDYTGAAGPRFTDTGDIIPHSILGSVDDFTNMAKVRGELPAELLSARSTEGGKLTVKYEKKPTYPKFESVEESNALKNWQSKMADRKKQQNHLTKMLNKAPDQLVMNQSDTYRQTQELRYIIDRTIPCMDYGKGYRVGSEFWKQQERIGDDLTGIHATLTQTEKGYPPPIEHVGVPRTVLTEKGTAWSKPRTPLNKPWHRNPYLEDRLHQLQPVISELDPYNPDMLNLEIIGDGLAHGGIDRMTESQLEREQREEAERMTEDDEEDSDDECLDPLRDHPDVHPEPVFGPSLQFAGQPARWTGDSNACYGQVGIEARVTFETFATKRVTSFLEISNDGTTAIYYDWKKIPKMNPFDIAQAKIQRFYFNTGSGVILPGDSMKFPFVFKSPNPGVFQEQWEFQTRPSLCGGATLLVTLRGVSLLEDKYKAQRTQLEKELSYKQAEQVVRGILDDVVEGLREQPRAASPIDAYITEEEIFTRKNPGMVFHNERVKEMSNLYLATFPEEERENQEWDLSVQTLKQAIMEIDEDDENKQDMLERLNRAVDYISFPSFQPRQQTMYNVGYESLCEMVDRVVSAATYYHEMLGMPEREGGAIPDDPTSLKSAGERDKRTPSQKSKPEAKDKKVAKDAKVPPKTGDKSAKSGKTTPGAPAKKTTARDEPAKSPAEREDSNVWSGDPVLEAKYRDKLYSQAYAVVGDSVDKMAAMLAAVEQDMGGPQLPKML